MKVSWEIIKSFVQTKSLSIQWIDLGQTYYLKAFDGPFVLECEVEKTDPANAEQTDFEANFKNTGNKRLEVKDSDGSILSRTKITTTGWHYQLHGLEFETSKLNSLESKKADGTDYGFGAMKFYELIEGVETQITGENLTQEYLDVHCVKTIMDWEPTHDLEIIGGLLKMTAPPTENLRMWTVGVPDVPEAYGGSKAFAVNINLKFIGQEEGVKVDGRAPKYLTYSAVYHTTKLRLILKHPAGFKHQLHMIFELFKA